MTNQITMLSYGSANAYLVSGWTGSILIDTGTEQYKEKILEACRKQRRGYLYESISCQETRAY